MKNYFRNRLRPVTHQWRKARHQQNQYQRSCATLSLTGRDKLPQPQTLPK